MLQNFTIITDNQIKLFFFINSVIKPRTDKYHGAQQTEGGHNQGQVVQSIVTITSSLRGQLVKCFMTLYPNTQVLFVEKKCKKLLQCKSLSHLRFVEKM